MDFGNMDISWFRFVPEFRGNRDLPKEERLSLEIRRLSVAEAQARYAPDIRGNYQSWRRNELAKRFDMEDLGSLPEADRELVQQVNLLDPNVVKDFQMFCRHSRNFENFYFDGKEESDPFHLYFKLPAMVCPTTGKGLIEEIKTAIAETLSMDGHELGNFVEACAGSSPTTQ